MFKSFFIFYGNLIALLILAPIAFIGELADGKCDKCVENISVEAGKIAERRRE